MLNFCLGYNPDFYYEIQAPETFVSKYYNYKSPTQCFLTTLLVVPASTQISPSVGSYGYSSYNGDGSRVIGNINFALPPGDTTLSYTALFNSSSQTYQVGTFNCQYTLPTVLRQSLSYVYGGSQTIYQIFVKLSVPKDAIIQFFNYSCMFQSYRCLISPHSTLPGNNWFTVIIYLNNDDISKADNLDINIITSGNPTPILMKFNLPFYNNTRTTQIQSISKGETITRFTRYNTILRIDNLNSLIYKTPIDIAINRIDMFTTTFVPSMLSGAAITNQKDNDLILYILNVQFSTNLLPINPVVSFNYDRQVEFPFGFTSASYPDPSLKYLFNMDTMTIYNIIVSGTYLDVSYTIQYGDNSTYLSTRYQGWGTLYPSYTYPYNYITSYRIEPLNSRKFIVTLDFTSSNDAGLKTINIYNQRIDNSNLIKGNLNVGTVEALIDIPTFRMEKGYSQSSYGQMLTTLAFDTEFINVQADSIPAVPSFLKIVTVEELTYWRFEPNNIDVSNGPGYTTLVYNYSNSQPTDTPSILISLRPYLPVIQEYDDNNLFFGYYNETTKLFNIPIVLREKLFTRSLYYNLTSAPNPIASTMIHMKFGNDALLNVTSKYADEMGPVINNIIQYPNGVVNIDSSETMNIGWSFTITDEPSGFYIGYALVYSDLDPIPYNISFNSSNAIKGNEFKGEYSITIPINGNCRTSTYRIHFMLYDKLGNLANSVPVESKVNYINPLYKFYGNASTESLLYILVNCSMIVDLDPPKLISLSVITTAIDVSSSDRRFSAKFTVKDSFSGISKDPKDYPYVYFMDYYADVRKIQSQLIAFSEDGLSATFKVEGELPYGFGMKGILLLSIYGIVDNHRNLGGVSSTQLKDQLLTYYIRTVFSFTPYLESSDRITGNGGNIYVYGKNMGLQNDTVVCFVNYGVGYVPTKFIYRSSSVFQINLQNVTSKSITIHINLNQQKDSNQLVVNVGEAPVEPNIPVLSCPGTPQCSNNGVCQTSTGECKCNSLWSGPDCNSRITMVPPPITQPDQPSATNVIDTKDIFSNISIHSLRELSETGQVIKTYLLQNWTRTNSSDDTRLSYRYTNEIPLVTNVSVNIEYFTKETEITFANKELIMLPSTIKYTINLSTFNFTSKLNTLQLVMSATIGTSSSSCSLKSFNNDTKNIQWIKLNIDQQSLYGKFLDVAEIDGFTTVISNTLLDSEFETKDTSSQLQTYIGINIPNYEYTTIIDPDFSMLIDSDPLQSSQCNEHSDNGGLNKAIIIGIVVGCVAFCIIVVALIVIIPKLNLYKGSTIQDTSFYNNINNTLIPKYNSLRNVDNCSTSVAIVVPKDSFFNSSSLLSQSRPTYIFNETSTIFYLYINVEVSQTYITLTQKIAGNFIQDINIGPLQCLPYVQREIISQSQIYPTTATLQFQQFIKLNVQNDTVVLDSSYRCSVVYSELTSCVIQVFDWMPTGWLSITYRFENQYTLLGNYSINITSSNGEVISQPRIQLQLPFTSNIRTTDIQYVSIGITESKTQIFSLIAQIANLNSIVCNRGSVQVILTPVKGSPANGLYNIFTKPESVQYGDYYLNIQDSSFSSKFLFSWKTLSTSGSNMTSLTSKDIANDIYRFTFSLILSNISMSPFQIDYFYVTNPLQFNSYSFPFGYRSLNNQYSFTLESMVDKYYTRALSSNITSLNLYTTYNTFRSFNKFDFERWDNNTNNTGKFDNFLYTYFRHHNDSFG
ncbi:hypothetical protein PPL_05237 [Heterostelium album PN500]|uniref:EGF-like domain-containing protein n=1 Tax=Heterostelium pallidum (strain ATCC 26659 / Pp 5 / PN500) TaxID=670386 RepID=D3B9U0_HETP5|nr:hypothetical protein PPL_05237 [Heterostelium album PN500]EFA82002.1 hypothetical protein PPL_05237 [Heterostelium album PN500]|eukprot:XP_020434119.1 hypothetical protein PPL_05237 [Heterostelium album PN500]